jgi:hypothetical protein
MTTDFGLVTQVAPFTCTVATGGVLAMRALLIHSSSKSTVKMPRRVLHIVYAASEVCDDGMRLALT